MKSSIDRTWILVAVCVVVLILVWKPMLGFFGKVSDKATNREGYERGRVVFYDTAQWTGPEGYKSCAMCHAPDFVPEPGREIEMQNYKEGQVIVLKDISKKYSTSVMDTGDKLYKQCMVCLTQGDRMAMGRVSMQAPFMIDLLEYVSQQ